MQKGKFSYAMKALEDLLEMRLIIYGEIHNKTAEVYEIMGKVKNDSHND